MNDRLRFNSFGFAADLTFIFFTYCRVSDKIIINYSLDKFLKIVECERLIVLFVSVKFRYKTDKIYDNFYITYRLLIMIIYRVLLIIDSYEVCVRLNYTSEFTKRKNLEDV